MGTPYKMKYTNGKKADPAAFPFNETLRKAADNGELNPEFEKAVNNAPSKMMGQPVDPNATIQEKVDAKIEEKVDEVVNNKTNEGLV
jgi:hypothetical protein